MLLSMTGFGDATTLQEGVNYAVEVRSVNNRYYKAVIKLPELLQSLESDVDRLLRQRLQRGSVTYHLKLRSSGPMMPALDLELLRSYARQLQPLVNEGLIGQLDLSALLALPGVCALPELDEETRQRLWQQISQLTDVALDKLLAMRRDEGRVLAEDLLKHTKQVREWSEQIAQRAPLMVQEYQHRLLSRVNELLAERQLSLQENDLLREISIFAERCDISEELVRLGSHLEQFELLIRNGEQAGRKLDFLAQEMLREANTVGSKAGDAAITRAVVEIKGLIDRLKEQVQNVE
ncbi:MAG: hypothetical protein HJJLKODD_01783 [Phycisphaerae bacterium]|nr:hypothetical protein [Phycisphaerae bacterium]